MAKRSTIERSNAPKAKARDVVFGPPAGFVWMDPQKDIGVADPDGRFWRKFKAERPGATREDFAKHRRRVYREYAERHNREAQRAVRRNRTVLRRHRAFFEGEGQGNKNTELFGFIGELARAAEAGNVDCANALCFMALQSQMHLCEIASRGKPWAFRMVLRLALHGVAQLNRLAEFLPDLARGFAERCSVWPLLMKPAMLDTKQDKPEAADARKFLCDLALGRKNALAQVKVRRRESKLGKRLLAWLGEIEWIVGDCGNTPLAIQWPEFLPENADAYARKFVEQMRPRVEARLAPEKRGVLTFWPDEWFQEKDKTDADKSRSARRMKLIRDTLKGIFNQLARIQNGGVAFQKRQSGNPVFSVWE